MGGYLGCGMFGLGLGAGVGMMGRRGGVEGLGCDPQNEMFGSYSSMDDM